MLRIEKYQMDITVCAADCRTNVILCYDGNRKWRIWLLLLKRRNHGRKRQKTIIIYSVSILLFEGNNGAFRNSKWRVSRKHFLIDLNEFMGARTTVFNAAYFYSDRMFWLPAGNLRKHNCQQNKHTGIFCTHTEQACVQHVVRAVVVFVHFIAKIKNPSIMYSYWLLFTFKPFVYWFHGFVYFPFLLCSFACVRPLLTCDGYQVLRLIGIVYRRKMLFYTNCSLSHIW